MSIKVISMVMERYPGKGSEYAVMLSLAENAHDDGSRVFPSVPTIARKARISKRQAQRVLKKLVKDDWLIVIGSGGGRNKTTHYRIDVDRIQNCPVWGDEQQNSDKLTLFTNEIKGDKLTRFIHRKGDILSPFNGKRVTSATLKGDIAVSPEPSVTVIPTYLHGGPASPPVDNSPPSLGDVFQIFQNRGVPFKPADLYTRQLVQSWLSAGAGLQDVVDAIDKAFLSLKERGPPGPAYLRPIMASIIDTRNNALKQQGGQHGTGKQFSENGADILEAEIERAAAEAAAERG